MTLVSQSCLNCFPLFAGCSGKSKKHWQSICYEDSQQVGDAEASWG